MIEAKNLHKKFGDRVILDDVSATFPQGTVNMIIGASGTGKSVLLKSIVGLTPPDQGSVFFDNRDFYNCDRETKKQIRREIGMLFQGGALFDSMNVEKNVMFPLSNMTNMAQSEKEDRVNICLKRVGLENNNKKMPSELSGGMKKRVGIARAIVMNSQYLFCDEPNSGLDPRTSILIDNLIEEITKEYNLTTIVVSHDMNSVIEIGEHIVFLDKGKIRWEGSNDDILGAQQEDLVDFLFSNKLMKKFRSFTQ